MESKRLPGKPMLDVAGRPLIHHVYEQAQRCGADQVIVAVENDPCGNELVEYCAKNDLGWWPTRMDHPTGTHRVAEAVRYMKGDGLDPDSVVINWQCDEPKVPKTSILDLLHCLEMDTNADVATLVAPINTFQMSDPNTVKAAVSMHRCHWFSRASMAGAMGHCGLYGFRLGALSYVAGLPVSDLSEAESLEQLTWLEHSCSIAAVKMAKLPLSINTRQDLDVLRQTLEKDDDEKK
jgi:3-deoxy-manno-octulosonate cytidylyltransferase (CMP-KDO synthetase)